MTKLQNEIQACKKQFYQKNKLFLTISIVLQTGVAAINVSLAFFIMTAISSMENRDTNLLFRSLAYLAVVMAAFLVLSMLLKYFKNSYLKKASAQFKEYVFAKILNKSIGEYRGGVSGQIISTFSNDLATIETNYLNGTIMVIYNVVMFLLGIGAMAFINIWMMLAVLVASVVPLAASYIYSKKVVKKEVKTSDENATFVDQMKDLLNGFFVIKSFKAEKEVLKLFSSQNVSLEETKHARRDATDIMTMTGQISSLVVVVLILVLGVLFTFTGGMMISTVIACVQLSNYIVDPVKLLVPLVSNRKAANSLVAKIAGVVKDEDVKNSKAKIQKFDSAIELNGVSYIYDGAKTALDNIDLRFEKGRSYALVGDSGSGKSTLVKLLLGYFGDYEGSAAYDGVEIRNIDLDSLYDVVSVVQQSVFLFDRSIMNNITMFKDFPSNIKERAIARAGLSRLIEEKGEDYNCGESGSNLSGGEKQRVSIARCLIKDTPILIMDEATASLDNAQAFQIENDILNMEGLTRVVVTHRLNELLLARYDQIVVLREGAVVEMGSFNELMQMKGYFYSLFNVSRQVVNAG